MKRKYILTSALIIIITTWGIWFFMTTRNVSVEESHIAVEREEWFELRIGNDPVLYYNKIGVDSAFLLLSEQRSTVVNRSQTIGRWTNRHYLFPSCSGRIMASLDSIESPAIDVRKYVDNNITKTKHIINDMNIMCEEMEYFFAVHDVQDAGYELVTEHYEWMLREKERLGKVLTVLRRCQQADSLSVVVGALYKAGSDTCHFDGRYVRTDNHRTPSGAKAIFAHNYVPGKVKTMSAIKKEQPITDGFGLRVTPERGVQLGEWEKGKFKGERLEHTPEHIYGIDISRFQHEKGKRRYSINWSKLRITSLGTLSNKKVKGNVDYPVSFCYVKATEGTTIRNRYYTSDYQQARRHGIKAGAYHFFSTKTSGAAQARWFLKNMRYQRGDFPPVLDIEPSEAQIRKMGGVDHLFREVRAWLNIVEQNTGKRPVLYISQTFVNRHLSAAPDLKRDYQIWIARYGEYKPDVHMLFWQLSPDGRVKGITPEVDINVFNGYSEKYQQFVEAYK